MNRRQRKLHHQMSQARVRLNRIARQGGLRVEHSYTPFQEIADVQLCSYCKIRPVEHHGVGGPKCTECEDVLFE